MDKQKHFVLSEITLGDLTAETLGEKEFEILSAGKKVYRGGQIEIKESDLAEFVENFNNDVVGTQLAVDINHDPNHKAFAWFSSVRKVGDKLMATFKDFTEEGKKLILEGGFKYFSVEIDNGFERIISGTKKAFKNVLRGVALTNRPVDKEIAPTFFSENLTPQKMDTILKLAESLCKRSFLSKEDKALWKEAKATLSDEDQKTEEVKKAEEKVEAKPEDDPAAAEAAKKAEEEAAAKKEEEEAEAKAKADEGKTEEDKKKEADLAETKKELTETKSNLGKLETKIRLSEIVKRSETELQLSEDNPTGLSKEDTAETAKFLSTLSNDQMEEVIKLVKKVKTVDFTEYGKPGQGEVDAQAEINKLAEAKVTAAKAAGESLKFGEAVGQVLSEKPELAAQAK